MRGGFFSYTRFRLECCFANQKKMYANDGLSREIVINSNDRVIRLLATREDGPPEQQHKFQDLVNRIQWNQCCLSSDADYVIGGSAHQAEHNIYIWDRIGGNLVKILEGPKEPLEDLTVRGVTLALENGEWHLLWSLILFFLFDFLANSVASY